MGADGLLLNDNTTLSMVVNGRSDKIFQLTSMDNRTSAKVAAAPQITDRFVYPSTATKNGKDILVMNTKFNQLLDSNSVPLKEFAMQKSGRKP